MREDNKRTVLFDWSDFYTLWVMAYETGYKEGYFARKRGDDFSPSFNSPPKFLEKMFINDKKIDEGTE